MGANDAVLNLLQHEKKGMFSLFKQPSSKSERCFCPIHFGSSGADLKQLRQSGLCRFDKVPSSILNWGPTIPAAAAADSQRRRAHLLFPPHCRVGSGENVDLR